MQFDINTLSWKRCFLPLSIATHRGKIDNRRQCQRRPQKWQRACMVSHRGEHVKSMEKERERKRFNRPNGNTEKKGICFRNRDRNRESEMDFKLTWKWERQREMEQNVECKKTEKSSVHVRQNESARIRNPKVVPSQQLCKKKGLSGALKVWLFAVYNPTSHNTRAPRSKTKYVKWIHVLLSIPRHFILCYVARTKEKETVSSNKKKNWIFVSLCVWVNNIYISIQCTVLMMMPLSLLLVLAGIHFILGAIHTHKYNRYLEAPNEIVTFHFGSLDRSIFISGATVVTNWVTCCKYNHSQIILVIPSSSL